MCLIITLRGLSAARAAGATFGESRESEDVLGGGVALLRRTTVCRSRTAIAVAGMSERSASADFWPWRKTPRLRPL